MSKKVWRWIVWAVWLVGMLVTKDNFGWKAVGLYALGSVTYSGFVLLYKEKEENDKGN